MISDKNPLSRVTYRFYRQRIIPAICIHRLLKPLSHELSCLPATKSMQGQLAARVHFIPAEVASWSANRCGWRLVKTSHNQTYGLERAITTQWTTALTNIVNVIKTLSETKIHFCYECIYLERIPSLSTQMMLPFLRANTLDPACPFF